MATETKTEHKTAETPKAAQAPSFPTFPTFHFGAFDPMAMWNQSQDMFRELMTTTLERAQTFAEQFATVERDAVARANTAVTTWAQLAQDAIAYGSQLSGEARKLGFETAARFGQVGHMGAAKSAA